MIDKLLETKGYHINKQSDQVITQEPFVSGYGLVYVDLPTALKTIIPQYKEIADYLIMNAKSCDLPNSSINSEPIHHGRNLRSFIPIQREDAHEINITFYETKKLTTVSILQMWQDLALNPTHYVSSISKQVGESLQDLIKSTVTVYIFHPNILKTFNTESILVVKLYGSYVSNVDISRFNLDYDNVDVVTVTASISTDRPIVLTKELAEYRGMSQVYINSIKALASGLEEAQKEAFVDSQQQLKNLYDKLKQLTEGK